MFLPQSSCKAKNVKTKEKKKIIHVVIMKMFIQSVSLLHKSQKSMSRLIKQNLDLRLVQLLISFCPHEGKLLSSNHL